MGFSAFVCAIICAFVFRVEVLCTRPCTNSIKEQIKQEFSGIRLVTCLASDAKHDVLRGVGNLTTSLLLRKSQNLLS